MARVSHLKGAKHFVKEYLDAEMAGRSSEKNPCNKYKQCPLSVFNVVKLSTILNND